MDRSDKMTYNSKTSNYQQLENSSREVLKDFKPYVPGKSIEDIKTRYQLDTVIKLASNENPHGTSQLAINAISNPDNLHLYPQKAYGDLQNKLGDKLNLNADQVIIGNGSDELIKLVSAAFINPGEEGLMADITFSIYKLAVKEMDGQITKVPLTNYKHDIKNFVEYANSNTKVIFICNPNNPTGTIITHEEAEFLMDNIDSNTIVVFDEAYSEYVTDDNFPRSEELVNKYPNLIVLRTFSKVYGLAALRVGYGFSSSEMIHTLTKIKLPFNVNQLGLKAAQAALKDKDYLQFSQKQNEINKNKLMDSLSSMSGITPLSSQGNFILVKTDVDDENLASQLLNKGVIIRSGSSLGIPYHFRLTVGTESEIEFFLQQLTKCEVTVL